MQRIRASLVPNCCNFHAAVPRLCFLMYRMTPVFASAIVGVFVFSAAAQNLTVQVGTPPAPPTPLVNHGDSWRYHKGTNAPVVGWQTNADASLGVQWPSGPGGIGYSADRAQETNNCLTILNDMQNSYRTLYMRRVFQVDASFDTNLHLLLRMDWDDGFVAYLDGVEVARTNAPGAVGVEPSNTALATQNHESSGGSSGLPAVTWDLGAIGSRLPIGQHTLAILGLNGTLNSSDLIMVPDLSVSAATTGGTVPNNGLYALASTNSVTLTGTNTVAGSVRVVVNGDDAAFNPGAGTWAKAQTLQPGMNRLFIAALDASGNILSNLTQDIVYEVSGLNVSGPLAADTSWTNVNQIVHVTGTVTIPASTTLTIGPGAVVIVSPGASIRASAGGVIDVGGADTREVYFLPATSNVWNEIAADGANSFLTLRHADVNRGAVKFRNGATGLMEDTYVHEYKNGTTPIAGCTSANSVTVRRCHFNIYHETLWQNTLMTIEDSLFENANNASSDALDFDGAPPGSVIRRTTFRFGLQSNTDAIDIGSTSTATLIESCLMHDFPNDKGVSIGETSYAITIRNCLMYRNDSGVAVKDDCTAIVENCTIANSDFGFKNFNKADPASPTGGGHITNSANNILWNSTTNISLLNSSTLVAVYSDFGNTNWPGIGNISADPLFVNAAAGDYRLQPGSPCIGTGLGGTNMGVTLPVGGIPSVPTKLAVIGAGTNFVTLTWQDSADNEEGFTVEQSTDALVWQAIGSTTQNQTNFTDSVGLVGQKYYYRVRATNDVGVSPLSNIASGARQAPVIFVGGAISANTVWGAGVTVIVTSSVTVAASATLTIEPCARVLFNQGASLIANGLLIAEGTPECRIVFTRNAGATSWSTIDLFGAANTHRLRFVDLEYSTGNIDATSTAIFLENVWWTNTTAQLVDCVSSSVTLLDSYIPGGAGTEPIHFSNMPANGYALIRNNVFGAPQGYNDSVDFTGGNRPGPIVQFIDNVFLAAVDDCFDMDGTDAHIEGNIFMNVHQDAVRDSTANAVSTGRDGSNLSELVVVRNIFYDCDHALLIKDQGSIVFENNTVVTIRTNPVSRTAAAYVAFGEPHRGDGGGRGILMNGNIMWDLRSTTPFTVFTNTTMFMVANDNIIQGTNMTFGGNSTNDPLFVNWQTGVTYQNIKSNLALLPASPAKGTGPNGLDRGALVPSGASISGEPIGTTTNTSATLKVAGPGLYAYRWKLNNGAWSGEVSLTNNFLITATMFSNAVPITLNNLSNDTYTVYVIGKNSAGFWQDTNSATVSKTWTVSVGGPPLDSDGDGMPDDWEMANGLNKSDPADAAVDSDGDGATNLQEYLAGTNPMDGTSRFAVRISAPSGNVVGLEFEALADRSYILLSRTSLGTGAWLPVQNFSAAATNRTIVVTTNVTGSARFFQVLTTQ